LRKEKACGVLVYRGEPERPRFLLICCRKHGHWGFPKGHVEAGESERTTALRELMEETGLRLTPSELEPGFRHAIRYRLPGRKPAVEKSVVFFLGRPSRASRPRATSEIKEFRWVSPRQAPRYLKFPELLKVLEQAERRLSCRS
jgi:8-oxo-dGTP pyrophosphatase MutT (NUDIX family)